MLDPTLLSSESNEPSMSTNEHMQKETNDEITGPKAEVRLVIRFTVEEQLVYNGKIERTQLLDSEELSRVVSRVAWEESKSNNEATSNEAHTEEKKEVAIEDKPSPKVNFPLSSGGKILAIASTSSPIPEVDAEFTCSDSHDLPDSSKFDTALTQRSEFTSIAQITQHSEDRSTIASECDKIKSVDKSLMTAVNIDNPASNIVPESCSEHDATSSPNNDEHNQHVQLIDSIQEHCNNPAADDEAVSQSITETLNDCVTRVDLEIRNCEDLATVDTVVEAPALEVEVDSRPVIDDDIRPKIDVLTSDLGSQLSPKDQVLSRRQTDSNVKAEVVMQQPSISCGDKDLTSKSTAQIAEVHSRLKRKDLDPSEAPAKRVRRANTREQQNLRQRQHRTSHSEAVVANLSSKITKPVNGNSANIQPVRQKIFAKWSDNHFYPGTILKPARDRKYVVGFYDGAQRNVAETDLIPLCNIHGKQVRVSIAKNYCVNAIVHEQRDCTQEPMFDVEYQQDGVVRKCVPLKDIFLTGDQGTPLISQPDRNSGASNFADVDLDNIIYEKRSRRFQELEDYELSENSSIDGGASRGRRKRGKYNMRLPNANKARSDQILGPVDYEKGPRRHSRTGENDQGPVKSCSPDSSIKTGPCPDSNPPSEGSSSTGSSNVLNGSLEYGQEFYFDDSSPHRTKTSLLL